MCTADKITLVYTVNGANGNARAASGTQSVINGCEIILYGNCTVGTSFLTFHTAYTSVRAILAYHSALIVVGALDNYSYSVLYKTNNAVGAFAHTNAAADTLARIYPRNTVFDGYSILGANLDAVTVSDASEGAEFVAAIRHISCAAGLVTLILESSFHYVTSAVTCNVSNSFDNVSGFNTEYLCDIPCRAVAAGNAEVCCIGGLVSQRLCITVAAGVSARATVCTGKAVADSQCRFIFLYTKEDVGKCKNGSAEQADTCKNNNWD